jgi:serine/threonine protein kinase/Tol biopolymer transport system component
MLRESNLDTLFVSVFQAPEPNFRTFSSSAENILSGYNHAIMSLAQGTQLGPYQILAPLGAGGMGEVYRAADTRLGRTVAIKVLPEDFASDPRVHERFEREARAISSLQHPHICVLYDIGTQDSKDYLVLEYLEGETLEARLRKGPLSMEQVLKYGAQIADALDKAHRQGITHRDLKPGNVMLTKSGVKLLDFGLAKPVRVPVTSAAPSAMTHTPTQSLEQAPITSVGALIGTLQYMSPEQLEGKEADARSDIFSLGCVLYEMATGKRAFDGKTTASVVASILASEPKSIGELQHKSPPALDRLVQRCLAKDPAERWQSALDMKNELEWISQPSGEAGPRSSPAAKKFLPVNLFVPALAAALLVGGAVATALFYSLHREISAPSVRAVISIPSKITLLTLGDAAGPAAISPDGRSLVFVGLLEGRQILFLRPINSAAPQPLTGTEHGKFPFWSADGKSIGFFADGNLKRLDLSGGPPTTLAPAPDGRGGTWAGNVILFTPNVYDVIYRIPATGGKPASVTKLDRSLHTTHRWPFFLPDGKQFLYLAASHSSGKEESAGIYVGSVEGGESKLVLRANARAIFASGHLLFYRDGSLMSQEFEVDRLEPHGDATPVGNVLRDPGNWAVMATASENGVLVFQSTGEPKSPIMLFNRSGQELGPAPLSGQLNDLRVSPDDSRAAVTVTEGPSSDAYVYDLKTGASTRLTFGERVVSVVWSPDGSRIVYSGLKPGSDQSELYIRHADGSGQRELLLSSGFEDEPSDWTRDGRYVIFDRGAIGSRSIWILPLFGGRKPYRLFPKEDYEHLFGSVSPDGKWIEYASRESGRAEIYVTSFPNAMGKWQVGPPQGGGGVARWRADGKDLYFAAQDGNMMVASVEETGGSFHISGVHPLFRTPFANGRFHMIFDVADKDGQRFIGSVPPDTSSLPLNVVTNWTYEPKKM